MRRFPKYDIFDEPVSIIPGGLEIDEPSSIEDVVGAAHEAEYAGMLKDGVDLDRAFAYRSIWHLRYVVSDETLDDIKSAVAAKYGPRQPRNEPPEASMFSMDGGFSEFPPTDADLARKGLRDISGLIEPSLARAISKSITSFYQPQSVEQIDA
jgi:hypothetical protein